MNDKTWTAAFRRRLEDGTAFTTGWTKEEIELPLVADCIHPGVFATGPVPGVEYCRTCGRDIPRELL